MFLGIETDGAGVVLAGADFRVAVEDVQEFQRRIHPAGRPGGGVGDGVGEV